MQVSGCATGQYVLDEMTQEVLTRITAATAAMLIGYLLYKVGLELWCVAYGIFI